jgi:uncharacterized protein YecE (DUF72 family)
MSKVKFGTAGWSYQDWKGVVYPKNEKDTLSYIMDYLDCVEINTTFYNIPPINYCKNWAKKKQGKKFEYIVKANRNFTHEKNFEKNDSDKFKEAISPLEKPLLLFQFPFYFNCNDKSLLHIEKIAENFKDFNKIIEVRSNTFDNPEVISKIHSFGFTFCLPDYPESKNSFTNKKITNNGIGYLRLHGRNYEKWFKKNNEVKPYEKYNYLYSREEEDELVINIQDLLNEVNVMYVIANNHYRGKAFVKALFLKNKLNGNCVNVPEFLLNEYPELEKISCNKNETLF